jgi:hypothetical protein
MTSYPAAAAQEWAQRTFGAARLGDPRRTRRAVQVAAALLRHPALSLPRQMGSHTALKGAYGLLHSAAVTHTALLTPTWEQTRDAARQHVVVLLPGDLTPLDYSRHPTTSGLGRIGNGRGRGYLVHSVLAVLPGARQVLGLAHQIPSVPAATKPTETLRQRQARRRETDVWQEAVEAIGPPPDGVQWVHVGDRGADLFRFLTACRQQHCHFLVRACKNRRITEEEGVDATIDYLLPVVRSWPAQAHRSIDLPRRHGKPARTAQVSLSWKQVELQVPKQEQAPGPLTAWVVRVWEAAPPDGTQPLEWVLLSSLPVTSQETAWERVEWYTHRWIIEEFHQCLKTGCSIEQRQLGDQPALERLLALCSPLAVTLLQLRDAARTDPDQPATTLIVPEVVEVVALLGGRPASALTVQLFWHTVARRGGWLGRTGDGPPGWKTLWAGWQEVQVIVEGVRLARMLPPHTSG